MPQRVGEAGGLAHRGVDVTGLLQAPLPPFDMAVTTEHRVDGRRQFGSEYGVGAYPEDVFAREAPQHPTQSDVGIRKDERSHVKPLRPLPIRHEPDKVCRAIAVRYVAAILAVGVREVGGFVFVVRDEGCLVGVAGELSDESDRLVALGLIARHASWRARILQLGFRTETVYDLAAPGSDQVA